MFSTELLKYHLKTELLGRNINYQAETNSTNADALSILDITPFISSCKPLIVKDTPVRGDGACDSH